MYAKLKQIVNAIAPREFLFRHEELIRWPYAVWFSGKTYRCNICKHRLRQFIKLDNGDSLCPFCGSSSRNRRLWSMLRPNELQGSILHFSPARPLYPRLKKLLGDAYISTDFESEFLADERYDITNIPKPDATFDIVICFHILEHIPDDRRAMAELFRVLKPGGMAYIQTPFRDGDIYENANVTTPEERLEHFGQEDHVRFYSVDGLAKRLASNGFSVSAVQNPLAEAKDLGLSKDDIILECRKPAVAERIAG